MTTQGYEAPDITQPYTYCELGCGHGYTTNILAAANPLGEFYATDFEPAHIANAKSLARDAQLKNVHFFDDSFAELGQRDDLPQFDFIVFHGILSWVSPAVQQDIVQFLKRRLKVGGVVYASYNAMPGCGSLLGLRALLKAHIQTLGGNAVDRIDAAVQFVQQVAAQNSAYFQQHPTAKARLDSFETANKHYLSHEYLHEYWQPFFHHEIVSMLTAAKLKFISVAEIDAVFESCCFTPEQHAILQTITDPILLEQVKDTFLNRTFRRDLFVRGARKLTHVEQRVRLFESTRFTLTKPVAHIPAEHGLANGSFTFSEIFHSQVLPLLAQQPHSIAELCVALSEPNPNVFYQQLVLAIATQCVYPTIPVSGDAVETCRALNRVTAERGILDPSYCILVAPVLGSGFPLDNLSIMLLSAVAKGEFEPAALVQKLQRFGVTGFLGKVFTSSAEMQLEFERLWPIFESEQLPLLRKCTSSSVVSSKQYSRFNKKRNILTLFCFPKHRVSTPLNALSMFWK
ncbi:MAG: methyltransferase domain-containing protein [Coleofasciculaceae cyanobacterium RL_1_1]|nr:methyltransferase domain-containing protein [Coleofasciculaceae cyanobacterium RL_1_1]